ncbi:MAG: hypothetical protein E7773_13770 [Sphingomonas sp.]|uniref:hypothetical protein n=1 Tax=Sphingomonas sp. TaxID=28214 RepID=UPI0012256516|nr:hypothetical protein [Sphingomonas sp.]THD34730.1 MAG: hypothetical protein E7773_13770 [Sphingomonas sp.]
MNKAICAAIALGGTVCVALPATAARHPQKRTVAEARFGLISGRSPRMGPQVVRRGGYTALTDMVRPRFFRGMTDIYPVSGAGFHVSIGSRYFARPNFWATAEQASRGVLFDPHWRGGGGVAVGFRRRTWALTTGYDAEVAPRLVIGIEGGALKGRAINPGPRGGAYRLREGSANRAGLNPIATLAVRFAF